MTECAGFLARLVGIKAEITFLDSGNDSRITYSEFLSGSGPKMSERELHQKEKKGGGGHVIFKD